MSKRGLKIFGMGIGGLLVVAGIIVGILFATGVIKVPSKDTPTSQEESDKKDILHPTKYCAKVPNITSFEKVRISGSIFPKYRITWSDPLDSDCAKNMYWWRCLHLRNEIGQESESCQTFKPTTGETYYDVELDNFHFATKGEVWLKISSEPFGGQFLESNKYSFSILPSK